MGVENKNFVLTLAPRKKKNMKGSKRYKETQKNIDRLKTYDLEEALEAVIKSATAKFDEGVEIHLALGIDPKKSDQLVRGTITFPYSVGKGKKIAVFAEGDKVKEAKDAGADIAGGQELIDQIKQKKVCDFEVAVAAPEMMKNLAPIAKILGPKGLMPSPKTETVTAEIAKTVKELKRGKLSFKNDDGGNLHQLAGKISLGKDKLKENLSAFLNKIQGMKPENSKGVFIKDIRICSTMGPGVKVKI